MKVSVGDKVVIHGRALIDGHTKLDGVVKGVGDNGIITASVKRSNGDDFVLPGTAVYGETPDGANWWEFPDQDGA